MIVLIDNYDSFSYNVYQLIGSVEPDIKVVRNDEVTIKELEAMKPEALILSPGPGKPEDAGICIESIKYFKDKLPILGICLGHQLLSIAHGYPTHKLKFGHHGGNHPIKNLQSGAVEITAQNHNYCVPESISEIATITHRNLFDNTIEGVRYKNQPIFSVQHHPEASPGPKEARILFQDFATLCLNE